MSGPTLLYGIGAAKSGTTWLYQVLRRHPECVLPPVKEIHYFDGLETPRNLHIVDYLIKVRSKLRDQMRDAEGEAGAREVEDNVRRVDRWLALVASQSPDDSRYVELLMENTTAQTRIVADLTPAYALLSEASFARMAALNGGKTRFLMILRDPLDRLWSNLAATIGRQAGRESLIASAAQLEGAQAARSDYKTTLDRLERCVPAEKRLYLFFENLFETETLERLATFLGLSSPLKGVNKKVNASPEDIRPTAEERARLIRALRPQYQDALARFGSLPVHWQANMQEIMA